MAGKQAEDTLDGSVLTMEYSAETQNDFADESVSADARTIASWLSEWTEEDATVRHDGAVTLPSAAMPLASLSMSSQLKEAGWRFDGYESHSAVYRRVER